MWGEIGDTVSSQGQSYADPATGITVVWAGRVRSSQEVGRSLLDAYQRHGSRFAEHIEGDFAVAICDVRNYRTVLARDPAGTVPLYYARGADGQLLFGTHIKELLPRLGRVEPDPTALLDYLTFLWSLDAKTFFRGVKLVPPGGVYDEGRIERYFTFEHRPAETRGEQDWCEAIVAALTEAVGDVIQPRLGCHLSGGVDSSAMAALIARAAGAPVPGFVATFPDYTGYDEAPYAQMVADEIGAKLVRVAASPDSFAETLTDILMATEEPKCHPPVFPRYLLESAAAEAGRRVMVSGRGADELFTGYDWHKEAGLATHRSRRTVLGPRERAALVRPEFLEKTDYDPEQAYGDVFAACPGNSPLERVMTLDFYTLMANWLVLDYKLSARFGIEPAAPFLDRRVIELAQSIPGEVKRRDDQPKALLKKALMGLVPSEIIDRKKVGFRTPMGEMLREGLEGFVKDALHEDTSFFWEVFTPAGVSAILDEHFAGERNVGWQIWALLCVREWFRLFIDGEGWRE
jgi:asparagine synthase (glutamine-hydrolysing)